MTGPTTVRGMDDGAGADTTPEPTDLLGTWVLTRSIDDRLAGERRDVHGTATLALERPGRVRWQEEGTMTWAGRELPVSRTLYVERGDAGWVVHFSDGRPFHRWSVGRSLDHPCAADHYRGRIEADGDPITRWTVVWEASGPEKDYLMTTVHSERSAP